MNGRIREIGLEDVGTGLGRHAGSPLPHKINPPDRIFLERLFQGVRKNGLIKVDHIILALIVLNNFPAVEQGALDGQGRFRDFLEEIVRKSLTVDIPRG